MLSGLQRIKRVWRIVLQTLFFFIYYYTGAGSGVFYGV